MFCYFSISNISYHLWRTRQPCWLVLIFIFTIQERIELIKNLALRGKWSYLELMDLISDSENISRKSLNLDLEPECLANWYVSKYTGNFNLFSLFYNIICFYVLSCEAQNRSILNKFVIIGHLLLLRPFDFPSFPPNSIVVTFSHCHML